MNKKNKKIIIITIAAIIMLFIVGISLLYNFRDKNSEGANKENSAKKDKTVVTNSTINQESKGITDDSIMDENSYKTVDGKIVKLSRILSDNPFVFMDEEENYYIVNEDGTVSLTDLNLYGDPGNIEEDYENNDDVVNINNYVSYSMPEMYFCGSSVLTEELTNAIISDVLGRTENAVWNVDWLKCNFANADGSIETSITKEDIKTNTICIIKDQYHNVTVSYETEDDLQNKVETYYNIGYDYKEISDGTPEEIINCELYKIITSIFREYGLVLRSVIEWKNHDNDFMRFLIKGVKENSIPDNYKLGNMTTSKAWKVLHTGVEGVDEYYNNLYGMIHILVNENTIIKENVLKLGYSNFLEYEEKYDIENIHYFR